MERIKLNIQKFASKVDVEFTAENKKLKQAMKEAREELDLFKAGIGSVSSSVNKFASNVLKVGKAFNSWNLTGLTRKITGLGNSLYTNFLSKAIDTSEELNLFNVVFNNIEKNGTTAFSNLGKKAVQFQNELNEAFGTNKKETMRYQGLFQAMGESAGLSDTVAALMSENMTKLAYDLASLYNTTETKAAESLRAGVYAGQTKPLRNYGIDVTQTSFKPIMEELGLEKSVSELTQAEKEILRYISTLRQAKNAMGDFANTIESPANQLKVLKQQFYEMQAAIGNLFVGAFARILPYVNAIIMVIKEIAKTIAAIFGIRMKDYNTGIATYEDGLDDYSESLDGVADSAGGASNAIKELKRQTLAFDQINNLTSPTPSSGSGGGGGGGISDIIDQSLLDALKGYENGMEKVRMKATEIRDRIMEWLGFQKQINEETHETYFTYDTVGKTIVDIAKEIGTNLGNMLNYYTSKIDWAKLGEYLAIGLNTAFGFMDSFVQTYDWRNLGNKIAEFINKAIEDTDFSTIGRVLTNKLRIAILTFVGFVEKFDFEQFGKKLAELINSAIENIPTSELVRGLNKLIDGIETVVWELIKGIKWSELFDNVIDVIAGLDWDTKLLILAPVFAKALGALFGSAAVQKAITEKIVEAIVGGINSDKVGKALNTGGKMTGGGSLLSTFGYGFAGVTGILLDIQGYKTTNTIIDNLLKGKPLETNLIDKGDSNWDIIKKGIGSGLGIANIVTSLKSAFPGTLLTWLANFKGKDIIDKLNNSLFNLGKTTYKVSDDIKKNAQKYMDTMIETDKQQRILKAATEGNYEEIEKIIKETTEESTNYIKEALVEQTKSVKGDLGSELLNQWSILAYSSKDKYKEGIKSLPDDLKDKIQKATGVVVEATPTMAKEFAELSKKSEEQFMVEFMKLPKDVQEKLLPMIKEKGGKIPRELQAGIDSQPDPKVTLETSSIQEVQNKINNVTNNVRGSINVGLNLPSAWEVTNAVGSILSGVSDALKINIKGNANGGIFANGRWQPIQAYANGGMPSGGSLFMAREAGPELVGKIGRHTAVMNNNQIVDSVKAGVYEAVSAAMSNSGGGAIEFYAHTDEGVIIDRINRTTRQTGVCPIEI